MIAFNNFNFAYHKKFPLYVDLNLELSPGKIYGLFGKNGAGKSTLLKNITGLNRPTTGTVTVNEKTPYKRKPSFLNDIFLIPEEVYIPAISQANYIKTYGSFYPNFSRKQFLSHLDELDVPETKNLTKLSFGQQKKFVISFALACNTSVLIMDEPTNGLDIPSKSEFRKLMAKTMNDDKVYIISTHQVRDLDNILDHILIVNAGQIVLDASIYDISKKIAFNFYMNAPEELETIAIDETIGGYSVMEKNTLDEETTINLEQLFNTTIINTDAITTLFN
ncbi:MAG: ABC-2 type transport system ATP-binding protein [Crocinitomix sp.]|jgi:ABC-2 type transport system ATP-binding protein